MKLRDHFNASFRKQRGREATDHDWRNAKRAMAGLGFAALFGLAWCAPEPSISPEGARTELAGGGADPLCEAGTPVRPTDHALSASVQLKGQPKGTSAAVPWQIGGATLPAIVDPSFSVREVCRSGKWSKLRVLAPAEFRAWSGWVPVSSLRKVPTTSSGRRIYQAMDVDWPSGSKPFRKAVVTLLNRVMQQRPECDALDLHNLVMNGRGRDASFVVPCVGQGVETAINFQPEDAASGRSFEPVQAIDHATAASLCEDAAKARAAHPSTVDFGTIGSGFHASDDGTSALSATFTAKNAFNLELTFEITCSFRGAELKGVSIAEADR